MILTGDMRRVVLEQQLGFVATVTADGRPNLSPKGTTTVFDEERLMFADVASPGTVANLAHNPHVEINVVDAVSRKGYRFRGTASVHSDGDYYEQGLGVLRERGSSLTRQQIRSIVIVEVVDAAEVVSPAYDTGAAEETVASVWLSRVTERHRLRFGPSGRP